MCFYTLLRQNRVFYKVINMKKVLILGAGMVVKPMVEYLLKNNFELMVASPMKERANELTMISR
jgi:glutamyl-tRNA reductase